MREKRLDIQGLRALAVALVVIYHLWPQAIPGGFVGVDVFFVISGFLITGHLLAEVDRTGTVSVTRFWARRIRRLLPAAFLVLGVCVVLAFTVLPGSVLLDNVTQIAAAAAYVVNWSLAFDSVDYLASENAPTLVQHYWSLSTEEQFYLIWPLLIVVSIIVAARLRWMNRKGAIAIVLGAVFVASLVYSVVETNQSPSYAYFITPTRAWEFAAGGLVAMAPAFAPRSNRARAFGIALSWAALALTAGSAFALSGSSPFPGWLAALPVAGAAALLWLGDSDSTRSPQFVSHAGPIQFLGDISYSVYLWHWPLIVAAPYLVGHPLGTHTRVAIIVATIALATASKYLVEDPVRNARGRLRNRWPAYAFAAAGMAVLLAIAPITGTSQQASTAALARRIAVLQRETAGCFGAYAILNHCPSPYAVTDTVDPEYAASDVLGGQRYLNTFNCELVEYGTAEGSRPGEKCGSLGGTKPDVVLVGDSHARYLLGALSDVGKAEGWSVGALTMSSCSTFETKASVAAAPESDKARGSDCLNWIKHVYPLLLKLHPSAVIFHSRGGSRGISTTVVEQRLRLLRDAGITVIVIEDGPGMGGNDVSGPTCVEESADHYDPCSSPVPKRHNPVNEAAALMGLPRIKLNDILCSDERCHAVIGGTIVYFDDNHLTATFAATLAPFLRQKLVPFVK